MECEASTGAASPAFSTPFTFQNTAWKFVISRNVCHWQIHFCAFLAFSFLFVKVCAVCMCAHMCTYICANACIHVWKWESSTGWILSLSHLILNKNQVLCPILELADSVRLAAQGAPSSTCLCPPHTSTRITGRGVCVCVGDAGYGVRVCGVCVW